jgi:AcrR family transcriptional regulator
MDSQVQKRARPAKRLTRKGEATRARIVEGAAAEFRRRGVADTTLDHVIERTETGKGQLFHYFPGGREGLLIAVAEHEAARVLTDQQPHLSRLATRADWEAWRDVVVARYRRQGDECPLSMLVSQIGRNSPAARAVTATLLRDWEAELAAGIRRSQEAGEIAATDDPDRTAAATVAAIQGGVVVLLATGEIDHLEAALDLVLGHLLGPATPAA